MLRKTLIIILSSILLGFLAFKISPWPGALIIRLLFNYGGRKANTELQNHVPSGIIEVRDQQFDPENRSLLFDVYYPRTDTLVPMIVWTHGGAFVSGNKGMIENYAKILAAKGYAVFCLDYSIAPESRYPIPLKEVNRALKYISDNHQKYFADRRFIIMGGDSAGAMITAQVANIITNPDYSDALGISPGIDPGQLKGVLLYCGFYDLDLILGKGSPGFFIRTVSWSYFGNRKLPTDGSLKTASVSGYLTDRFPPVFISAGNADPLLEQSEYFAKKLRENGIRTDELFFEKGHVPGLGHEYQFTMDRYGKQALERSMFFIESINKGH